MYIRLGTYSMPLRRPPRARKRGLFQQPASPVGGFADLDAAKADHESTWREAPRRGRAAGGARLRLGAPG